MDWGGRVMVVGDGGGGLLGERGKGGKAKVLEVGVERVKEVR